jgi:Trk K+ transport system NAD-binding subunit
MPIRNVSIEAAYNLFDELKCCSDGPRSNGDFTSDAALALFDVEKIKCHIINCLAALSIVEIATRHLKAPANERHELLKRKVFKGACSVLINAELDTNQTVSKRSVLHAFPDMSKMTNGQSWMPMHFAIVLFAEGNISEEDVQKL